MKLNIIKMKPEHIPAVAALEGKCFSEPWTEDGFLTAIESGDNLFLVALLEEKVVGYCGMYISLDEGEITNVAVEPEFRKSGFGKMILAKVKEEAAKKGVLKIFLEVRQSNEPAIALYSGQGFENVGIRKNFYRMPTEDAIVMMLDMEK